MTSDFLSPKKHLHISGITEGISYLVLLLIAMPLKYWADMPLAVRITGMAHGVLFIWYVSSILWARMAGKISNQNTILMLIASLIPLGTFYADRKVVRAIPD